MEQDRELPKESELASKIGFLASQKKKKFRLKKEEFGRTYHVCGSILCEPNKYAVIISDCSERQKIFIKQVLPKENILEPDPSTNYPDNEMISLPESTPIIAKAFRQNTMSYETMLNKFIGYLMTEDFESSYIKYLKKEYGLFKENNKAIIHVRNFPKKYSHRNLRPELLTITLTSLLDRGIKDVIFVGDTLDTLDNNLNKVVREFSVLGKIRFKYLNQHDKFPPFQETEKFIQLTRHSSNNNLELGNIIAGQLIIYHVLYKSFNVKCTIGVKSGALDGLAFTGLPIIFFTLKDKEVKEMVNASYDITTLKPIICGSSYDSLKAKPNTTLAGEDKSLAEELSKEINDCIDYVNENIVVKKSSSITPTS